MITKHSCKWYCVARALAKLSAIQWAAICATNFPDTEPIDIGVGDVIDKINQYNYDFVMACGSITYFIDAHNCITVDV